jgi:hypothetical protein
MQQMARNVTMKECGALRDCRYLLHDRDTKYTQSFRAIIASGRVEPLVLPGAQPEPECLCGALGQVGAVPSGYDHPPRQVCSMPRATGRTLALLPSGGSVNGGGASDEFIELTGSMGDRHRLPKAGIRLRSGASRGIGRPRRWAPDLRNNPECDGRHLFSVSYLTEPGTRPPYKAAANPRDPGGNHFGSHVFSSDDSGHHRFACGCGGENRHCSTWHLWGGSCRYPARHSATA